MELRAVCAQSARTRALHLPVTLEAQLSTRPMHVPVLPRERLTRVPVHLGSQELTDAEAAELLRDAEVCSRMMLTTHKVRLRRR